MDTLRRREITVGLMECPRENLDCFLRYQGCLRDLPYAELHLTEFVALVGDFLRRVNAG